RGCGGTPRMAGAVPEPAAVRSDGQPRPEHARPAFALAGTSDGGSMRVGVWIPCYRRWIRHDEVREIAQTAEGLGFGSLWVQDHLVAPIGNRDEAPIELQDSWLSPDDYGNESFSAVEY